MPGQGAPDATSQKQAALLPYIREVRPDLSCNYFRGVPSTNAISSPRTRSWLISARMFGATPFGAERPSSVAGAAGWA